VDDRLSLGIIDGPDGDPHTWFTLHDLTLQTPWAHPHAGTDDGVQVAIQVTRPRQVPISRQVTSSGEVASSV
jgi:hypothetical protein